MTRDFPSAQSERVPKRPVGVVIWRQKSQQAEQMLGLLFLGASLYTAGQAYDPLRTSQACISKKRQDGGITRALSTHVNRTYDVIAEITSKLMGGLVITATAVAHNNEGIKT